MSKIRLGGIALDCDDHDELSSFWSNLLGGEVVLRTDEVAAVRIGHLLLTATRVSNHRRPTWPDEAVPKRAHIDVDVDDLADAERRAVSIGAVRADRQPDPTSYLVFFDPAGHPFCLTTQIAASGISTDRSEPPVIGR